MKGDDVFDIPVFTESGEINPLLIQRIRQDFGTDDENKSDVEES